MKRILFSFVAFVLIICAWAPWLGDDDGRRALDLVRETGVSFDGNATASDGTVLCDGVAVRWVPFGRQISDCSTLWFVTFWGGAYDGASIWGRDN